MNSSIQKALLFVIALSTSIIAVQLIPISRKAYLYNLCRDYVLSQEQSYALISKDSGEEKNLEKAINKLNRNIKKLKLELEKELNLYPPLESQEQPAAFCQRIGIKWNAYYLHRLLNNEYLLLVRKGLYPYHFFNSLSDGL